MRDYTMANSPNKFSTWQRLKQEAEQGFWTYKQVELSPEKRYKCTICNGSSWVDSSRTLHQSGGIEPCGHCINGIVHVELERIWNERNNNFSN